MGDGEAGKDDREVHARLLVHVRLLEVLALLHGEERRASGIAHDAHPIPPGRAERLCGDVTEVGDGGTDRSEGADRRIRVVGLATRHRRSIVAVVGHLDVLHEVEGPERPIILGLHLEPPADQFDVDGAVGVIESFSHVWSCRVGDLRVESVRSAVRPMR